MKKISILLASLMFLMSFQCAVMAKETGVSTGNLNIGGGPGVTARSAILMDAKSGEILYAKNIDAKRYPASITKIMTTLVAIENCESLYETLTYSEHAINSIEPGSSQIYILPGETLTLEESLYAIMLESANEACNGVAEHIGGSIEGFVDMMNEKAKELGCKNTHFMNPNGLHHDDHYVSARDMATITRAALANDTFRKIASTISYTIPSTNKQKDQRPLWNHHKQVKRTMFLYDGVEGGKTGFTVMARNTLVTWAERDGLELIAVVLKDDGYEVYRDTIKLFDHGFKNFKTYNPIKENALAKVSMESDDIVLNCGNKLTPFALEVEGDTSYSVLMNKSDKLKNVKKKAVYDEEKKKNYFELYYNDEKIGATPFTLKMVK